MKIPKYIDNYLDRRVKSAEQLMKYDWIITDWLDKYDIEVEDFDYCTGVEMYMNPVDSANRIRKAILNKKQQD